MNQTASAGSDAAVSAASRGSIELGLGNGVDYGLKLTRHGYMLFNRKDIYIGRSLDLYGEYSEAEYYALNHMLGEGQFAIEVGANIGALTVPMARRVGPNGRVLAFEPQRVLHQILCANLALNTLTNVSAVQAAVGARAGSIGVPNVDYRRFGNFGGVSLAQQAGVETVAVRMLDEFAIRRCDLLKIDVEGMELEVLQGATALIERTRPRIYIENNRRDTSPALIAWLRGKDYRLWWHVPHLFNPGNFFANAENVFEGAASCNMIGIHASQSVKILGLQEVGGPDDPPPIGEARLPAGFVAHAGEGGDD